jgi:hypothetical protein
MYDQFRRGGDAGEYETFVASWPECAARSAEMPRLGAVPPMPATEVPSNPTAAARTIPGIHFNLNLNMRIIPPFE